MSTDFGFAQTPEEIESMMNEIKLDENFVYGCDFNQDKDIAFQNALTGLTMTANELRTNKGKNVINPSDLLTMVKELKYKKGNRYTVLLYLPINRIFDIISKSHSDILSQNKPSQSSLPENTSLRDPEEEQKVKSVPDRQPDMTHSIRPQTPVSADIIQTLCSQDNWIEIKGLLTAYKSEGKISTVGNVLSYAEVPEDAYAILMDDMGGILSILSPKNRGSQINYRTNQADNETKHSNCKFIFWYK